MSNINVKAILRKDSLKGDGTARIDFQLYFEGKQFRVSSGKCINPQYWDSKQRVVNIKAGKEASEINFYLTERLTEFDNYIKMQGILGEKAKLEDLQLILKGSSIKDIANKDADKEKTKKKVSDKKKKQYTISEAFDKYLKINNLVDSTKRIYTSSKNVLLEFCKKEYGKELTIDKIERMFLDEFQKYLREDRVKSNEQTTIAKRLKHLKAVINYFDSCDLITKNPFKRYTIEQGKPKKRVVLYIHITTLQ